MVCLASLFSSTSAYANGDSTRTFSSNNSHFEWNCAHRQPDVVFQLQHGFDWANSYLLMQASFNAQSKTDLAIAQWNAWGFDHVTVWLDPLWSVKIHVASHPDFNIVAIRGTTTPVDYVGNALFQPVTERSDFPGAVHQGFWLAFKNTQWKLQRLLENLDKNKPVIFTGHSRGGALAMLHALQWSQMGGQVAALATYAQPRVGNAEFNAWAEKALGNAFFRLDLVDDVTPHVPPMSDVAESLENQGYINRWVSGILASLDYSATAGLQYTLTAEGQWSPFASAYEEENAYWQSFFATLHSGPWVITLPAMVKRFPVHHKPERYLCAIAGVLASEN